jgi:ubiquinone/menaquinone biosynthesis C-methylase UbiE
MENKVRENHRIFLQRLDFYKENGLDQLKEKEFILAKSFPIAGKILEIGTGKGHFALALAKQRIHFISVDISKQDQEIAKLNLMYYGLEKFADFKQENAEDLSFKDDSFDVIFCVNCYHHLKSPFKVLTQMQRIINPKGRIILADFNSQGMGIIEKCHRLEGRQHEHFCRDLKTAEIFFLDSGCKISKQQSFAHELLIIKQKDR